MRCDFQWALFASEMYANDQLRHNQMRQTQLATFMCVLCLFLICGGLFSGSKHAIPSQIGPKFFPIRQFFIDCQSQRRNVHQPTEKRVFAVSHAIMWRIMIDLHVHEGILPEARRETHLFRAVATVVVLDSLFFFSGKMMDGWSLVFLYRRVIQNRREWNVKHQNNDGPPPQLNRAFVAADTVQAAARAWAIKYIHPGCFF